MPWGGDRVLWYTLVKRAVGEWTVLANQDRPPVARLLRNL